MLMILFEDLSIHRVLYRGSSQVLSYPLVDGKLSEVNGIMLGRLVGLHIYVVYWVLCQIYSCDNLANSPALMTCPMTWQG